MQSAGTQDSGVMSPGEADGVDHASARVVEQNVKVLHAVEVARGE